MNCKFIMAILLLVSFCTLGETIGNMASSPETIAKWQSGEAMFTLLTGGGPGNAAAVRITSDNIKLLQLARYRFDTTSVIGKNITVTCEIKAENIAKPEQSYMGVKLQLMIISNDGKVSYFEQLPPDYRFGSFNWKGAKVTAKIPDNTQNVYLVLGLQNAVGSVFYANITCNIED